MSALLPQERIGVHPVDWEGITLPHNADEGIKLALTVLIGNGVETYQSCQGGAGHSYPEPTVEFHGDLPEGFRALSVALTYGLHVDELRRVWSIQDGVPTGPFWAMTFREAAQVSGPVSVPIVDGFGGV